MAVQVSDFDRFSFTLFMALALHAVLVLGVTFAPDLPSRSSETMEITLSQFDDEQAPDEADFLAQTSQQGSGSEEERRQITSPEPVEMPAEAEEQVLPQEPAQTRPAVQPERQVVETRSNSEPAARQKPEDQQVPDDAPVRDHRSLMERSLEIARLEARYDEQMQAYAKKPRVLRVTAASTLGSTHAWYVQNWIDRVVRVGNLNFPTDARGKSIHGAVRLLVVVKSDGTLKEVNILESSGSSVLDDSAIRIMRMAAPFASFSESMEIDRIEIIRTFSFQRKGLSSQ
ncbi:TonB family protein [Marinobacter sp.]|uniref:TonB family protein n=1 Tax=Marinobacter sp. TaxID=50741 RepID=UPI00384FE78F